VKAIEQVDFEPPAQIPSVHLLTWAQLVNGCLRQHIIEQVTMFMIHFYD
jgi:hypothetical protein